MTVLSAQTIMHCHGMITPFQYQSRKDGVTFGLSAAGYDVRIEFDREGKIDKRIIWPGGDFMLASTIERFKMPNNVVGIVHDKSTWARRGLTVQNTVIEPGWEGWLTLELINHGRHEIELMRGVGIAQVVFHFLDHPTNVPYVGKYQMQDRGPVQARIDDES